MTRNNPNRLQEAPIAPIVAPMWLGAERRGADLGAAAHPPAVGHVPRPATGGGHARPPLLGTVHGDGHQGALRRRGRGVVVDTAVQQTGVQVPCHDLGAGEQEATEVDVGAQAQDLGARQRRVQAGPCSVQPAAAHLGQFLAALPQREGLLQRRPARLQAPYDLDQLVPRLLVPERLGRPRRLPGFRPAGHSAHPTCRPVP